MLCIVKTADFTLFCNIYLPTIDSNLRCQIYWFNLKIHKIIFKLHYVIQFQNN